MQFRGLGSSGVSVPAEPAVDGVAGFVVPLRSRANVRLPVVREWTVFKATGSQRRGVVGPLHVARFVCLVKQGSKGREGTHASVGAERAELAAEEEAGDGDDKGNKDDEVEQVAVARLKFSLDGQERVGNLVDMNVGTVVNGGLVFNVRKSRVAKLGGDGLLVLQ